MQKLTKYECIIYFSTYITPSLVVIVLFFGLGNRGTFCLCFCRPAFCRRHFLKMGLTNSHLICMPGTGILDLLRNILVCTLQLWVHRVLFDLHFAQLIVELGDLTWAMRNFWVKTNKNKQTKRYANIWLTNWCPMKVTNHSTNPICHLYGVANGSTKCLSNHER